MITRTMTHNKKIIDGDEKVEEFKELMVFSSEE
jgi:hypothetical protein